MTQLEPIHKGLREPPKGFFMSLRDVFYWLQNARVDALLARLVREHGDHKALELLYQFHADPWASTPRCYRYQRMKYDALLSMVPDRRYSSALDVGCGLGVLTRQLAPHTDHVLGIDISETAIRNARELSIGHPNVRFEREDILDLDERIYGQFDLIVLAEVLYYLPSLTDDVLKSITRVVENLLTPGGVLLLANHSYFNLIPASRVTPTIRDAFRWAPTLSIVNERWRPFYLTTILTKRA